MDNEKQFTITENGVLIECISDSTEITIPKEVTSIEEGAFEECEKLTSVIIPGTVKTIGAYSFFCLTQLKSVKLGEGVTSIENFVFHSCDKISKVEIPSSVTFIGASAFSLPTIIHMPKGNEICYEQDGCILGNRGQALIRICEDVEELTVPSSVISLEPYAFAGCEKLESITISSNVISIEDNAFENCTNLKSVIVSNSSTKINKYAFYGCRILQK